MPMNPILTATLRRNWQVVGAVAIVLVLMLLHAVWFTPTAARYQRAMKTLGGQQGLAQPVPDIPPRMFALIKSNALPEREAVDRGNSGQLTVTMIGDLTALASASGLTTSQTEPGATTQLDRAVQLRAHLKLRGPYRAVARFLDSMSAAGKLDSIERFTIGRARDGSLLFELWVTRVVLKQKAATS